MERKPCFERILKTMHCEEPDYVPVAELGVDTQVKELFLSKPVRDVKTDVEFWWKAGYDYIYLQNCVNLPFCRESLYDISGTC